MSLIKSATRDEWLEARRELLIREKALTQEKDSIAAARRALPWVKLDKSYTFEGENGDVPMAALFGKHSQLIVYHFMFGPEWDEGCVSCSFWADSFNGLEPHLNARDTAFAVVSRAPMQMIAPFKKRMGWSFNWVSSYSNEFNADFQVSFGSGHKPDDLVFYNFREKTLYPLDEAHGTSVFAMDNGQEIHHTYSTYGRGLDVTNAAYSYIDLTPKGRNEPTGNTMGWVRHHDSY